MKAFIPGDRAGLVVGAELMIYALNSPNTIRDTVAAVSTRYVKTTGGRRFKLSDLWAPDRNSRISYWSGRQVVEV